MAEWQLPLISHFPPFYTRQPNEVTWASQQRQWSRLILDYYKHKRLFVLRLNRETIDNVDIFTNSKINQTLQEVINFMVGQGDAEYIGQDGQTSRKPSAAALVYWRRPEEWATMLSQALEEGGQRGAILTAYEIQEGESAAGRDSFLLTRILSILVKRGVATVFKDDQGQESGIKFHGL